MGGISNKLTSVIPQSTSPFAGAGNPVRAARGFESRMGSAQPWYANQLQAVRNSAVDPGIIRQMMQARMLEQQQSLQPKGRGLGMSRFFGQGDD